LRQLNIIYLCAESANNLDIPDSKIWDLNLRQSLIKLGHNIILPAISVTEQYQQTYDHIPNKDSNRVAFSESLLDEIKKITSKQKVDLIFSYFYAKHILPEAIKEIKRLGVPTVNFYCNAIHQFHLVSKIAPVFDYCMVPEKEALNKYISVGANPIHIQMAANPDYYKPLPVNEEFDVTFVGQNYLNRGQYINFLYNNGVDVKVWGPNWKTPNKTFKQKMKNIARALMRNHYPLPPEKVGGILTDDELIKMYSKSRISLGFSEVEVEGNLERHVRLRDFEAPMSRALYFTGFQEELAEYYDIGKEIICYDTKEELLEKIQFYLRNQSMAEKVREAGYNRALRDHTWEKRFQTLFESIGLK